MPATRTNLPISLLLAAVVAAGAGAPESLGATAAGEPEVDRAMLAKRAKRVVERRNRVSLRRVSRCGPRTRGKPESRRWVCEWRAEGSWSGDVPYRCAGDALWNRKRARWRVDRCHNRLQPQAPLLDLPSDLTLGYNDDWIALGKYAPPELLELLEQSGAEVARTGLIWWRVEGDPGTYDWLVSDILYERLLDRGIKPLWTILDAPCWAQPDPAGCAAGDSQLRPAPQHYDEMADFAVAAAKRYPESVGIEVWNEPNYPQFWGGWPEPARYAEMLREVAGALHREVPGMPVVSAGLSPHGDTDQKAIGYGNFIERLYELGAAQEADAIGLHPYPGVGPGGDYVADVRVHLGKVQEVMERFGDAATPLWVTEFGVSTGGDRAFDPAAQGRALVELYELFRRVAGVELAVAHRFVEDGGIETPVDPFGVLDRDLVPKPAYCDLARARDSSPPVCLDP
jgi:hypothetical protein